MGGNQEKTAAENQSNKRMSWFKVWADPWFDSTMRIELTNDERGIWLDLLALACRSRFPGVIASGRDEKGEILGYPIRFLVAKTISWTEKQINSALEALQTTGRIRITETRLRTGETGLIIAINSWEKWQSEYARTKKYYEKKKTPRQQREEEIQRELRVGRAPSEDHDIRAAVKDLAKKKSL